MAKRDYYEVLGVERTASLQDIKSAYRKLAVQYHPDRNPGDGAAEEAFKEAAEAYSVLSDSQRRARYDRFGHQGGVGGFSDVDPSIFADFSDILGDFFGFGDLFGGRRRGRSGAIHGADLRYDLMVTFEEAAFGTEPTLRIPRLETCETCRGTCSAGGAAPRACSACAGQGQVRYTQGFFTVARTCPQCNGAGTTITDPCPECRGEGRVTQERSIQVRIPPGVDSGARLRLAGEGEHGLRGGSPGDLYVVISVEEHEKFTRRGADVLSVLPVPYPVAVLGGTMEVGTLHGPVSVDISPGTPHGELFRFRGKGVERLDGGGRGSHIVQVQLEVPHPRDLEDEQISLLRQLAERSGDPVREERKVLDRMKDLFG
jgi:molecular chaperone DnaJ